MAWRSKQDVITYLKTIRNLESLDQCYALHLFSQQAVFPEDYTTSTAWKNIITPSDEGKWLLALYNSTFGNLTEDVYFALLGLFFHHDILIDYENSDLKQIASILSNEIINLKMRYPL